VSEPRSSKPLDPAWDLDRTSRDVLIAALLHDQLLTRTETFVVASVALPAVVKTVTNRHGH